MPRTSPDLWCLSTSRPRRKKSAWHGVAPGGRQLFLHATSDRHRQALEIVLMLARHARRLLGIAAGDGVDDRLVALGDLEEVEPFDKHGDRRARLDLQRLPDVEQQP